MAASKRALFATALCATLATPTVFANDDVLRLLARQVTVKTALLGVAERECTARETTAPQPGLTAEALAGLALQRSDLVLAVGYLAQRNRYACSHAALADLLLATTVLERAQKDYGRAAAKLSDDLITTVQPSPRYFEMAVAYARLPESSRASLEQMAGSEPFDLSAALQKIPRD